MEQQYDIDMYEGMKFGDKLIRMEGIITEVHDGAVAIALKGRLGTLRIPKRMIISDYDLEVGQEAAWIMSFVEQISPEPNQRYLRNLKEEEARRAEILNEFKTKEEE